VRSFAEKSMPVSCVAAPTPAAPSIDRASARCAGGSASRMRCWLSRKPSPDGPHPDAESRPVPRVLGDRALRLIPAPANRPRCGIGGLGRLLRVSTPVSQGAKKSLDCRDFFRGIVVPSGSTAGHNPPGCWAARFTM
jgi:hypothetical protein